MAERQRITKRLTDALKVASVERIVCNSELPGFGVRVASTGRLTYVLQYCLNGRQRRHKVATHG